jgi:hypothetical protein
MIGHHRLAQQLRIILIGRRIFLNTNRSSNPDLLLELSQGMLSVKQNLSVHWSEMPAFWHFSEEGDLECAVEVTLGRACEGR